jgi:hypothetical protein
MRSRVGRGRVVLEPNVEGDDRVACTCLEAFSGLEEFEKRYD